MKIRWIILVVLLGVAACSSSAPANESPAPAPAEERSTLSLCYEAPVIVVAAKRLTPAPDSRITLRYNAPAIRVTAPREDVRLAQCQFDLRTLADGT